MLALDYKQLHLGNHTEKGIAWGEENILFPWENKVVAMGQKMIYWWLSQRHVTGQNIQTTVSKNTGFSRMYLCRSGHFQEKWRSGYFSIGYNLFFFSFQFSYNILQMKYIYLVKLFLNT